MYLFCVVRMICMCVGRENVGLTKSFGILFVCVMIYFINSSLLEFITMNFVRLPS